MSVLWDLIPWLLAAVVSVNNVLLRIRLFAYRRRAAELIEEARAQADQARSVLEGLARPQGPS